MQKPWKIKEGPEYDRSVSECDVPTERLDLHLSAFRLNLEWDPFLNSHIFEGESRRLLQTNDYVGDGFVLTAYYVLYKDFTVEIKWIEASSLPADEEIDEKSDSSGEAPVAAD